MTGIEEQLTRLATLSSGELKDQWRRLTKSPAPKVSPALLRLALAWELQARAYGGHTRETVRRLDQLAAAKTRTAPAQPGMRLVRAWQGKAQVVVIGEDGVIRWEGRAYRSLSAVARAITGTRWSGPAFFGLKTRAA